MIDLPPPLILPQAPALIRPIEGGLWGNADRQMQALGLPRHVRRAVQSELTRVRAEKPGIVRATLQDLARYAREPGLATLPFPFIPPVSSTAAGIQFSSTGRKDNTSGSITMPVTFTAYDIGAANVNRVVIAMIYWNGGAASQTHTSSTIGGVAAAVHQSVTNSSIRPREALISAVVPTGPTADVVVTLSATITSGSVSVAVWWGITTTPTPLDTLKSGVGGDVSTLTDLQVAVGGWVVGGFANTIAHRITATWNGVDAITENFDADVSVNLGVQGLMFNTTEAIGTRDLVGTSDIAGTAIAGCAASWSP